jgi:hypothetical protein
MFFLAGQSFLAIKAIDLKGNAWAGIIVVSKVFRTLINIVSSVQQL